MPPLTHRAARPIALRAILLVPILLMTACTPRPVIAPSPTSTAEPSATATPSPTSIPISTSTPAATQTPFIITATNVPDNTYLDLFVLSITENGYVRLFAFSPQSLPLTRLAIDPWDDITPALSPDGLEIAFSSRRNGYWDLYLLSLETGGTARLTDSLAYDGAPSWSPDGIWLAYESYSGDGIGGLDIYLRSVEDPAAVFRITDHAGADFSPAWAPYPGRQIAFVSNRSGNNDIWIADLDIAGEERFTNVSRSARSSEDHPTWSPDGTRLAWASTPPASGLNSIYIWDSRQPDESPHLVGSGDWPVWSADGSQILTRLSTPNQDYLTGYSPTGGLSLPPVALPGSLRGLTFKILPQGSALPVIFQSAAAQTPAPLYIPALTPKPDVPAGRLSVVDIPDVQAPYPRLNDMTDESFIALRQRIAAETGWDVLGSLENAFVPLTVPLSPGMAQDWLYSGRAFSLNSVLLNAGWIAVVREDFSQQTYWRVYLKTIAQDGSQGEPLRQFPWDFSTRYGGSQRAYEQGGSLMTSIPSGYWVDFTSLALQYGWERLPALTNWRTYYAGARFNEFALTGGLDWYAAMLQIYPEEALLTPTAILPTPRPPTRTPPGYKPPTPTRTPTPNPTFTPKP